MSRANTIRIAVQLQPIHCDYATLRRRVAEVDRSGADILFNSDHFFPSVGDPTGKNFEAWTLLAAWAEQTENVHLGVSVSGNGYRNANLLADMARTVDHISSGRAILGLGAGWFRKDFDEYGFEFVEGQDRLHAFQQTLEAFDRRQPLLNPPPVRGKVPVMIGNGGDHKPATLVARHADIWLDFKDVETVDANNRALDAACVELGKTPEEVERGVALFPEQLGLARKYSEAGCTLFMLRLQGPDFDLGALPDWIGWRDESTRLVSGSKRGLQRVE